MRYLWVWVATLAFVSGAAMAQSRDEGRFDIMLLGLKAGELRFVGTVQDDRYVTSGRLGSTGILAFVREVSYVASAEGRVLSDRFVPSRYTESTDTGSRVSEAEMDYVNGTPQVKRYAPARDPRPEDVDPSTQSGTVDPMTALYALLRDVPRTDACTLNVRMFDGRRASRVQMSPEAESENRIDCNGAYVRVAGFSEEDMAERRVFPFTLRYAPAPNGRWRVERVELRTLYGRARLIRR